MAGYVYDPVSSRYRAPSGRYVSQKQLHGGVVRMSEASGERMAGLATRLQAGQMKLVEWQAAMHAEIRSSHLAASMAAHGGKAMMAPADYGFAGSEIKKQLGFLKRWTADLASGSAPLDGRFVSRARLYATSSVGTFSAVQARDARNSGAEMEERSFRGGSERPCGECPALAARGWVSSGTLPLPGQRECGANCKCRVERRLVVREEAA